MAKDRIELAAITGAHGVAGEVRLKLFGEDVGALAAHDAFNDGALTPVKIRSDGKGGAIARFAQIANRTDAKRLRGTVLTVPREALPPLDEGEYYHADLIGLAVETDDGESVGVVIAVENFGATDVVEIRRRPPPAKGAATFMVPMTDHAVLSWDEAKMVIAAAFAE